MRALPRVAVPIVVLACLTSAHLAAQSGDEAPDSAAIAAWRDSMRAESARLQWQQGKVVLEGGLATLDVPAGFRYLDAKQSEWVLEEAWGNPDGSETLGMLFPADVNPVDENSWGVVITFDEHGYVKDDEAATLDYDKLLREMRDDLRDENKERVEHGYEALELVGWAEPPHYDSLTHKLYWAKELKFGDADENTLNYNVRVLGRRGVLVLNAVGGMSQLAPVDSGMRDVLAFVDFNQGHRYTDFDPGVDRVAAYGIGALVAGKVAAKVGLFKVVLGALVAAKKLVLVAIAALAGLVKKLFGRKPATTPSTS